MAQADSLLKQNLPTVESSIPMQTAVASDLEATEPLKFDASALERTIGYRFTRPELLAHALSHRSHSREVDSLNPDKSKSAKDNEQLEFLGDAVLGFVTAEFLCQRFPEYREGELSKLRAYLVSQKHLVTVSRTVKLGDFLRLGKGEEKTGGRNKTALLVDALEAVLGAIYIDGGLEPARDFVTKHILSAELERVAGDALASPLTDYKSALQGRLRASGFPEPEYALIRERGPDHSKIFSMEVRLQSFVARAEGHTKKSAEQEAAMQALEYLDGTLKTDSKSRPDKL